LHDFWLIEVCFQNHKKFSLKNTLNLSLLSFSLLRRPDLLSLFFWLDLVSPLLCFFLLAQAAEGHRPSHLARPAQPSKIL
jgi:hypothetical protein